MQKRKRSTAKILLYGFFFMGCLLSIPDLLSEGNISNLLVMFIIMTAFTVPLIRNILHRYYSFTAKLIAGKLLPIRKDRLSFDSLSKMLSLNKPVQKLSTLIEKGYLQKIYIDNETRLIYLGKPIGRPVSWVCSSCGAKNSGRTDEQPRCTYCGQPYTEK